jgi:hypothetical protein
MSLLPPRLSIRSNPKTIAEEYEELLNFTPRSDYPEDHPAEMRRNAQKIADMEKNHSVYELEGDVEIDNSTILPRTKDFPPISMFAELISSLKFPRRITLVKATTGQGKLAEGTKGYLVLMEAKPGRLYSPEVPGFLFFRVTNTNASAPAYVPLRDIFWGGEVRDVYGDAIKSTYSDMEDFKLSPGAAAHLKAANPTFG